MHCSRPMILNIIKQVQRSLLKFLDQDTWLFLKLVKENRYFKNPSLKMHNCLVTVLTCTYVPLRKPELTFPFVNVNVEVH